MAGLASLGSATSRHRRSRPFRRLAVGHEQTPRADSDPDTAAVYVADVDGACRPGSGAGSAAARRKDTVCPGFELIAQAVANTLRQLPDAGLDQEDEQAAEDAAREALTEVTQPVPDRGKLRRAVAALKGAIAPLALGMAKAAGEGAGEGAAERAAEWARTAIEQLDTPF